MDKKIIAGIVGGVLLVGLGIGLATGSSEEENTSVLPPLVSPTIGNGGTAGTVMATGDGVNLGLSADDMRLEKYTGSVALSNGGASKAVVTGSRLVTGDLVETLLSSIAYLVLDQSKALSVNEISEVEIQKLDDHLDVHLATGSVFFNVTSPLTESESLEFHTNNVVTGVRGTSGIISYDEATLTTQIVVTTGSVVGQTETEEKTVSAGEVGLITTHPDGTVSFEIISAEEDEVLILFQDDFIDGIQDMLSNEGNSFAIAESVRMPAMVTLPSHISVIGDVRTLTQPQAMAFRQALEDLSVEPTHVAFFDGGNDVLTMVAGDAYTYEKTDFNTYEKTTHSAVNYHVIQWNGSGVEVYSEETPLRNIHVLMKGEQGYFLSIQKTALDTPYQNHGYTHYFYENGIMTPEPVRYYANVSDSSHILNSTTTSAKSSVKGGLESVLPNLSNILSASDYDALLTTIATNDGQPSEVDGQRMTYRSLIAFEDGTYALDQSEVFDTYEEVLDFLDVDSPYWNSLTDVLPLLEVEVEEDDASEPVEETDSEEVEGDSEEVEGDSEEVEGDSEEAEADSEEVEGDSEEAEGDSEEVEGDSEEVEETTADTSDTGANLGSYESVLSEYRALNKENLQYRDMLSSGVEFSYDFFDIDNNGTEELLVYMSGKYLTGIYTLEGDNVVPILDGYAFRVAFAVYEDGTFSEGFYYSQSNGDVIYQWVNGEKVKIASQEMSSSTQFKDIYTPDEATYKAASEVPKYVPDLTVFFTYEE